MGDRYSAWDGYIEDATLELVPGKRIVQSWRRTEFGANDPDSTIVVDLDAARTGTRFRLTDKGVLDDQTSYEKGGWRDFYFAPMKAYFETRKKKAKANSAPKATPGDD